MISFRWFVAASVAAHVLLLGARQLGLWEEPDIRFTQPESTVSVRFAEVPVPPRKKEAENVEPAKPTPMPEPELPQPLPETPPAPLPPETQGLTPPPPETTVAAPDPAPEKKAVEKPVPSPQKKADTPKKKQKPRKKPAQPANAKPAPTEPPAKPAADKPAPAQTVQDAPPTPEPAKELILGQQDAPSYAHFFPPDYPQRARRRNIEGKVLLRVLISEEGRARDIEVIESSHPEFTQAAKKSARRSRYIPMKRLGQPQEVWVLIPFHFKLR